MTKQFNLSEEIWEIDNDNVVHIDDVKEFIRLLKEKVKLNISNYPEWFNKDMIRIIDKLAGNKLI